MAEERSGRGGAATNSPYGPEDDDRAERPESISQHGAPSRGGGELRSWLGFGNDDPPGEYGRGVQSWGQANEGGNWGSGQRRPDRGHYGPEHGHGGFQGDYGGGTGQGGFGGRGDWQDGRQSFTSGRAFGGQDEAYLSWRDRQIAQFDRDYEDYCREHSQDFGSSFDAWRRSRQAAGSGSPSATEQPDTARSKN